MDSQTDSLLIAVENIHLHNRQGGLLRERGVKGKTQWCLLMGMAGYPDVFYGVFSLVLVKHI